MKKERIKEIQKETAYPDSVSVYKALLQVWNECEQDRKPKLSGEEITTIAVVTSKLNRMDVIVSDSLKLLRTILHNHED